MSNIKDPAGIGGGASSDLADANTVAGSVRAQQQEVHILFVFPLESI